MLLFATSDKGGTGRSVTSCNVAYRRALQGGNVCYVDFDFGSPTAGAIFNIDGLDHGTTGTGVHDYLQGRGDDRAERYSVWETSDRRELRVRPDGAGELVLLPGDADGSEFPGDERTLHRCVDLFLELDTEFDLTIVDLSAGRSHATELAMAATADGALARVPWQWIVFHRWTKQHVLAAASLVHDERGLLSTAIEYGHSRARFMQAVKFVRTAVVDPDGAELAGLKPTQVRWLRRVDADLHQLAREYRVGRMNLLGAVPLDPVLQWREQVITDTDSATLDIANQATVDAFSDLAKKVGEGSVLPGLT
jgi:hypothetical protein